MELEFKSVKELFEFIEELGYVKKDSQDNKIDDIDFSFDKITINKTCPYGFVNCPYNKDIPTYYPNPPITVSQPFLHTDVGASQNTEWETKTSTNFPEETITINMRDISQNYEKKLDNPLT